MVMRGIRGAITVDKNNSDLIIDGTKELLKEIVKQNNLQTEDICSVLFTITKDLNAEFPALAAREMGWNTVPLLCALEPDISGALPRCIRVLIHVNTRLKQNQMKHVYLRDAVILRPDLANQKILR
ncbi:chorismate mutase [Desulfofalx alkaliphila]|uniref:chorismate mutase n=1 Tax=Desulfofalx alkaliphila TaxID=105483 RepID=UPI003B75C77D